MKTIAKRITENEACIENIIENAKANAIETKDLSGSFRWSCKAGTMWIFSDNSAVYCTHNEYSHCGMHGNVHDYKVFFTNKAKGYKRFTATCIHKEVTLI